MRMFLKFASISMFILAIFIFASSCEKNGKSVTVSDSSDSYNVKKLFEVDGCTVYRFNDARSVYFTNCKGETNWQESCGKNCTRNVGVKGGR